MFFPDIVFGGFCAIFRAILAGCKDKAGGQKPENRRQIGFELGLFSCR
jgi:hypothetical protein